MWIVEYWWVILSASMVVLWLAGVLFSPSAPSVTDKGKAA